MQTGLPVLNNLGKTIDVDIENCIHETVMGQPPALGDPLAQSTNVKPQRDVHFAD